MVLCNGAQSSECYTLAILVNKGGAEDNTVVVVIIWRTVVVDKYQSCLIARARNPFIISIAVVDEEFTNRIEDNSLSAIIEIERVPIMVGIDDMKVGSQVAHISEPQVAVGIKGQSIDAAVAILITAGSS